MGGRNGSEEFASRREGIAARNGGGEKGEKKTKNAPASLVASPRESV